MEVVKTLGGAAQQRTNLTKSAPQTDWGLRTFLRVFGGPSGFVAAHTKDVIVGYSIKSKSCAWRIHHRSRVQ